MTREGFWGFTQHLVLKYYSSRQGVLEIVVYEKL
jgi:hypothetical protein